MLEVYEKAYRRHVSYTAWLNGSYSFEAHSKAIKNGNRGKASDKVYQYNEWKDPVENLFEKKITKDNIEEEFRKQQIRQQAWLRDIINKK